jgi:hypothetical protein
MPRRLGRDIGKHNKKARVFRPGPERGIGQERIGRLLPSFRQISPSLQRLCQSGGIPFANMTTMKSSAMMNFIYYRAFCEKKKGGIDYFEQKCG